MRKQLTSVACTGDDLPCIAQKCYSGKGGGNAGVVMARHGSAWLEEKLEKLARAGVQVRHLCC